MQNKQKATVQELICAVRDGELQRVKQIIDTVGLFIAKTWASAGYILVLEAIENNHTEITKLLLLNGARVNCKQTTHCNKKINTPLHYAVRYGNVEIVKMLLVRNAVVDARDKMDRMPLYYAIEENQVECGELLVNYGAHVNVSDNEGTLLHTAAMHNCFEILLKHEAYINSIAQGRFCKGYTPLHYAVQRGSREIVTLLLKNNCDVDAKALDGITPLHVVAENGNIQITEDLLTHGDYVNPQVNSVATSAEKDTPLHLASARGSEKVFYDLKSLDFLDVAKLLLSKEANVNSRSEYGRTPLHAAVEEGYEKLVEMLLEYNADVNSVDINGTMPIHSAAKKGNVAIMRMLINKVADINAKDEVGYSALHIATVNSHGKLVEFLLKCGADYDSRTKDEVTPLYIAAQKGSLKNVLHLLKFGADINAADKFDRTALQAACVDKYPDIITVLLENGADMNKIGIALIDQAISYLVFLNYDEYGDETANILVQYMVKLTAENVFVINENYSQSISANRYLAELYTSCESEIIEMRSEKIGNTNVTFYDILTNDINQLAIYARNEDILHVLESQVYQEIFPRYANMIHNRFSNGQKKVHLLNSSVKCFNLLFGYELPELFTNQMIRYLSIMDLENLIEAYDNTSDDDQPTSMQDI